MSSKRKKRKTKRGKAISGDRERRQKVKYKLWAEQGFRCPLCEQHLTLEEATVDHIEARANGGTNAQDNLQMVHAQCNAKKGTMPHHEAREEIQKELTHFR